jgi:hypothetical protein
MRQPRAFVHFPHCFGRRKKKPGAASQMKAGTSVPFLFWLLAPGFWLLSSYLIVTL